MKRLFMIALVCVATGMAANAQNSEKRTTWYVKVGGAFCTLADIDSDEDVDLSTSSKLGYLVGIALDSKIGSKGWFWSAGLQLRSKGGEADTYSYKDMNDDNGGTGGSYTDTWNNDYTYNINTLEIPLAIGYKLNITDDLAVDLRIGGFIDYDLWGDVKHESYGWYDGKSYDNGEEKYDLDDVEGYESFGYGALAGIGVWYKNFNLNFTYEYGLAETFDIGGKERNMLLTLGYAF